MALKSTPAQNNNTMMLAKPPHRPFMCKVAYSPAFLAGAGGLCRSPSIRRQQHGDAVIMSSVICWSDSSRHPGPWGGKGRSGMILPRAAQGERRRKNTRSRQLLPARWEHYSASRQCLVYPPASAGLAARAFKRCPAPATLQRISSQAEGAKIGLSRSSQMMPPTFRIQLKMGHFLYLSATRRMFGTGW